MKILTRINFLDFEPLGTVALVPCGLCGLSEMYFFYFAFMSNVTGYELCGTRHCPGLQIGRTRGNPRSELNPSENRESRGLACWVRAVGWCRGLAERVARGRCGGLLGVLTWAARGWLRGPAWKRRTGSNLTTTILQNPRFRNRSPDIPDETLRNLGSVVGR